MYQKSAGLLAGVGLIATAANAGTLTVDKTDITLSGVLMAITSPVAVPNSAGGI